eukprot:PhF_6_TR13659/c0_g3_i2/m.21920
MYDEEFDCNDSLHTPLEYSLDNLPSPSRLVIQYATPKAKKTFEDDADDTDSSEVEEQEEEGLSIICVTTAPSSTTKAAPISTTVHVGVTDNTTKLKKYDEEFDLNHLFSDNTVHVGDPSGFDIEEVTEKQGLIIAIDTHPLGVKDGRDWLRPYHAEDMFTSTHLRFLSSPVLVKAMMCYMLANNTAVIPLDLVCLVFELYCGAEVGMDYDFAEDCGDVSNVNTPLDYALTGGHLTSFTGGTFIKPNNCNQRIIFSSSTPVTISATDLSIVQELPYDEIVLCDDDADRDGVETPSDLDLTEASFHGHTVIGMPTPLPETSNEEEGQSEDDTVVIPSSSPSSVVRQMMQRIELDNHVVPSSNHDVLVLRLPHMSWYSRFPNINPMEDMTRKFHSHPTIMRSLFLLGTMGVLPHEVGLEVVDLYCHLYIVVSGYDEVVDLKGDASFETPTDVTLALWRSRNKP